MRMDESLFGIQDKIKNYAIVYLVSLKSGPVCY